MRMSVGQEGFSSDDDLEELSKREALVVLHPTAQDVVGLGMDGQDDDKRGYETSLVEPQEEGGEKEEGDVKAKKNKKKAETAPAARDGMSEAHAKMVAEKRKSVGPRVLSFQVTKVNQRGRKQNRTLRLSLVGIENVRGDVSSSIYEYTSVKKIVLNSVAQFSIFYATGKHPYVYVSPVAIQIVSEITVRVNTARSRASVARQQRMQFQETLRLSMVDLKARTRGVRVRQLAKTDQVQQPTAQERVAMAVWSVLNSPRSDERKAMYRFVGEQKAGQDGVQTAQNTRAFLDGLRFHFLQTRAKELAAAAGDCSETGVKRVIEMVLENAVIPLLFEPMMKRFLEVNHGKDEQFVLACAQLANHSQEMLFVPRAFCTATNYMRSAIILSGLEGDLMPADILECILKTVRSIYSEVGDAAAAQNVMAGDDFLPVLIFVVVRSKLRRPFAKAHFACELCDPEELQGEAGYFLTVFESALIWIMDQLKK